MDKNKSIYKLSNIPDIYWLNLDSDIKRRKYMESQFDYWEVKNHHRISGYDGRVDDISSHLKGKYPDDISQNELGCVLSHLKAIKEFYYNSDAPFALIMEDDVSFETVKYWNFTWRDIISSAPYGWDVLQLSIICTGNIVVPFHNRFINDFSAACYLITRHHAQKIIKNHIYGDKYRLDNGVKPRPVSEDLIYGSGVTFSSPLFLYNLDLGSTIHPEHIDAFHKNSYNAILNFWKTNGPLIPIEAIGNYDPYLGRISNPGEPK
jgi:hypothetical protein